MFRPALAAIVYCPGVTDAKLNFHSGGEATVLETHPEPGI
jgi:hypothetical protein